jgi:hypothetical protein
LFYKMNRKVLNIIIIKRGRVIYYLIDYGLLPVIQSVQSKIRINNNSYWWSATRLNMRKAFTGSPKWQVRRLNKVIEMRYILSRNRKQWIHLIGTCPAEEPYLRIQLIDKCLVFWWKSFPQLDPSCLIDYQSLPQWSL